MINVIHIFLIIEINEKILKSNEVNHSLKRDNTGLVMDANGNELPYTESKGKHPAKIVEGDGINHEGKSCVEAHPKGSHKDWEKGQIDLIEKSTKLKESKKIDLNGNN